MKARKVLCIFCLICSAYTPSTFAAENFDMQFAGGTLADLADELRALNPNINVVLTPGARESAVPDFSLRNIGVQELFLTLRILGRTAQPPFIAEWRIDGDSDSGILVLGEERFQDPTRAESIVRPVGVGQLTDNSGGQGFTIEKITSAAQRTVEAYYELRNEQPDTLVKFQYHRDTGILILSGERNAVELALMTIGALREESGQ